MDEQGRVPAGGVEEVREEAMMTAQGNQDGFCTDCGEPVWWSGDAWNGTSRLVTKDGNKWCYGPGRTRISMERQHALPGMPQWVAPAREGQVCHCLARKEAHIHLIVPAPEQEETT